MIDDKGSSHVEAEDYDEGKSDFEDNHSRRAEHGGEFPHATDIYGGPRFLFIRDPETDDAVSFELDPKTDAETLILSNTRRVPEGFPSTTRLKVDRNVFQSISAVSVEKSEKRTAYTLHHEPTGERAEHLRLTVRKSGGPKGKDQTVHGVFKDVDSDKEYEVIYVGDPNQSSVVVIVVAGALLCVGAIVIGALVHDCASSCADTCGGGENVKSCVAEVTVGVSWGERAQIGCLHECGVECQPRRDSNLNGGWNWWPS